MLLSGNVTSATITILKLKESFMYFKTKMILAMGQLFLTENNLVFMIIKILSSNIYIAIKLSDDNLELPNINSFDIKIIKKNEKNFIDTNNTIGYMYQSSQLFLLVSRILNNKKQINNIYFLKNKSYLLNYTRMIKSLVVQAGIRYVGAHSNSIGIILDDLSNQDVWYLSLSLNSNTKYFRSIFKRAPRIITRQRINLPLICGITSIDSLFPLGRGQRELLAGGKLSGKTSIVLDFIFHQRLANQFLSFDGYGFNTLFCFYNQIGGKLANARRIRKQLIEHHCYWYTGILTACANESFILQYLAPYTATALAEYFRDNGLHALIIYDDLTKHADSYKSFKLILKNKPGREAYPADMFYQHSKLLERSGYMTTVYGSGSLTSIPMIEMSSERMDAFLLTNLISICDGQVVTDGESFNQGIRPAVRTEVSVSRVGSLAQIKLIQVATGIFIRSSFSRYRRYRKYDAIADKSDETVRWLYHNGHLIESLFSQDRWTTRSIESSSFVCLLLDFHYYKHTSLNNILWITDVVLANSITELAHSIYILKKKQLVIENKNTTNLVVNLFYSFLGLLNQSLASSLQLKSIL